MKTQFSLNLTIGISLIANLIVVIIIGSLLQYVDLTHVTTVGSIIFLTWFLLPKIFPIQKTKTIGTQHDFGMAASCLSIGLLYGIFPEYPKSYLNYILNLCRVTPFLAILFWLYSLGLTAFPLVLKIIWLLLTIPMIYLLNIGANKLSYAIYIPGILLPILEAIALITGVIKFSLLDRAIKVEIGESLLIVIGFTILAVIWAGSLQLISNTQIYKSKVPLDEPRVCIFVRIINPENQDCKANSTALDKQRKFLHKYANKQGYKLDRIEYIVDNDSTEETEELKQYCQGLKSLFENQSYNIFLVEQEENLSRFGIEEAKRILEENGKYFEVFNQDIAKLRKIKNQQIFTVSAILQIFITIGGLVGGWWLNLL
ncbi:MAG: hypothetical protein SWX82_01230 [Cyanobacteriota bacterium]|nr:hypothetical protein [Cyanobacteriota bacterium]